MKPSPKSLIELPDGRFELLRAGNMATKRATGKCIIKWCRNRLPASAIRKHNTVCSKCAMRRWRANNPLAAMLLLWRNRAKTKGVPFDLTITYLEWLLEGTRYVRDKGRFKGCLHLDRVVASRGYVRGNVRVLPAEVNCSKGALEKNLEPSDPF